MKSSSDKISVLVLYNQVDEDEYVTLKTVNPKTLDFTPEYNINTITTVLEEYSAIVDALTKEGFNVRIYNIKDDIQKLSMLLHRHPPDVIFNLVEFFHDSQYLESSIAGLYDLYAIPYTGCSSFSLGLCLRKGLTKKILLANGILTPKFLVLNTPTIAKRHGLTYPLIVKPSREDASTGVDKYSVVHNYPALQKRVTKMFAEHAPPIMIEEYIEGRELHVSILGNNLPIVLPPIEYDFSELPNDHPNILTYDAKWNPLDESFHQIHAVCPASLTPSQYKNVETASLAAYRIMGCRDYARIDLRLGKNNKAYILEVNPNPDLTEGVSFMDSAEKGGLSFSQTLAKITRFALDRKTE